MHIPKALDPRLPVLKSSLRGPLIKTLQSIEQNFSWTEWE